MYIILFSLIQVLFSQVSVENVQQNGFEIHFNPSQISAKRFYWATSPAATILSGKEIMNGVSQCAGKATRNQLLKNIKVQIGCSLENRGEYTLHVLAVNEDDAETFQVQFTAAFGARRRLLTPSAFPSTGAPTSSGYVAPSARPSSSPETSSPTTLGSTTPSASPSTEVTVPVLSTDMPTDEEENQTFAGMWDLSSTEGVGYFIGTVTVIVLLIVLVLAGPCLYRRYHQKSSPALPEHESRSKAKLSTLMKNRKAGSGVSMGSEASSFEVIITAIKSEDKIRMAEPCE